MIRRVFLFLATLTPLVRSEVLIPAAGVEWRYQSAGAEAKNWRAVDFDDSPWAKGKGPLGYGCRGLVTELKVPAAADEKPVTAWFRHSFEVAESSAGDHPLVLTLRVDDGAAVFLNGGEIARFNLPENAGAETPAIRQLRGEPNARRIRIQSAKLLAGRNLLAVEVHQANKTSDDLLLDVSLSTGAKPAGPVTIPESAREATMAYYQNHYVPPGMTVPDGYVDGGRRMVLGKNAVVLSTREILVIDRTKDEALRKHLAYAKDPELLKLPAAERAKNLAQYVDKALSPGGDRHAALRAVEEFTIEYANQPVLFGDMEKACQSGVCRHRALLFKMLCDDAGLKVALVRGNYDAGITGGGHAWNELILDDGSRVIVDVMNPDPDFKFIPETDPAAKPYLSVKNEVLYPRSEAKKAEKQP